MIVMKHPGINPQRKRAKKSEGEGSEKNSCVAALELLDVYKYLKMK